MSPVAMDGTPTGGSAASAASASAASVNAPPRARPTLAGVLERANALAIASPANAEPLYRHIIHGHSDLVVTPADDVNAIKQAAIIGALLRAGVWESSPVRICLTLWVLCELFGCQWCLFF